MSNKNTKKNKNSKNRTMRKNKPGKKWITAISAAENELKRTGSVQKARLTLRKQALTNARKLFGSIGKF